MSQMPLFPFIFLFVRVNIFYLTISMALCVFFYYLTKVS